LLTSRVGLPESSPCAARIEERVGDKEGCPVRISMRAKRLKLRAKHVEMRAKRLKMRAKHVEMRAKRVEMRAGPVEMRATQVALRAVQVEMRAAQVEVWGKHVEMQARHVEMQARHVEMGARHVEVRGSAARRPTSSVSLRAPSQRDQPEQAARDVTDGMPRDARPPIDAGEGAPHIPAHGPAGGVRRCVPAPAQRHARGGNMSYFGRKTPRLALAAVATLTAIGCAAEAPKGNDAAVLESTAALTGDAPTGAAAQAYSSWAWGLASQPGWNWIWIDDESSPGGGFWSGCGSWGACGYAAASIFG
jgi:hypothetical protein